MPKAAGVSGSDPRRGIPPTMKPTIEAARRVVRAAAKNASEIMSACGVAKSTASMIRSGQLVPTLKHWTALEKAGRHNA